MERQVEYNVKKSKSKRKVMYEYFFSFSNRNNKLINLLADCEYLINSKEMVQRASADINRVTEGNFQAIIYFQLLRKKYVSKEEEE